MNKQGNSRALLRFLSALDRLEMSRPDTLSVMVSGFFYKKIMAERLERREHYC